MWFGPNAPAPDANIRHFAVMTTPNGSLKFSGNRLFWANFVIEVGPKYRHTIFGDQTKQYLSMHPITGAATFEPYTVDPLTGGLTANVLVPDPDYIGGVTVGYGNMGWSTLQYVGSANFMHTVDRRVTLEVGCSLPVKNSPMVDHGVESPDFVLGRYMFHRGYNIEKPGQTSDVLNITVRDVGTKTLQGPRDRVVFHHLQPQQKIQTLRLRLWARVRTYDIATQKYGMKTIVCPVSPSDFWHVRLHFVPK